MKTFGALTDALRRLHLLDAAQPASPPPQHTGAGADLRTVK
jgi:hypothetical protein